MKFNTIRLLWEEKQNFCGCVGYKTFKIVLSKQLFIWVFVFNFHGLNCDFLLDRSKKKKKEKNF